MPSPSLPLGQRISVPSCRFVNDEQNRVNRRTYSFHSFRTVFRCAFRMFPTSNNQQYSHLSAFSCTYGEFQKDPINRCKQSHLFQ